VALRYADGVVMAGDRRATAGNIIAQRDIEKVFPADRYSAIAIAGTAGVATEMVRLFQVQLEHYEKVEGSTLSLEGKANQLAGMVRQNLPMAMPAVPAMATAEWRSAGKTLSMAWWAMMLPAVARRSPAMMTPSASRSATTVVPCATVVASGVPVTTAPPAPSPRAGKDARSVVRFNRPTKSGPGSRSGGNSGSAKGYCPPFCT